MRVANFTTEKKMHLNGTSQPHQNHRVRERETSNCWKKKTKNWRRKNQCSNFEV